MKIKEFKRDISVDKHLMDQQFEEQPSLYFKYAEISADAAEEVDNIKEKIEVARAELDLDIRSNLEKYGLDKAVEGAIKASIAKHRTIQKLNKELIAAQRNDRLLKSALSAIEHRKRALTKLAELYVAGYFSEVRAPGQVKEIEERRVKESLKNGLKKNKRLAKRTRSKKNGGG